MSEVACIVHFDGWQVAEGGKLEVYKPMHRMMAQYKFHKDEGLFEVYAEAVETRYIWVREEVLREWIIWMIISLR